MHEFVPGKILCRQFFLKAVEPILSRHFPDLAYSAGLLGYGSDVLGYDDSTSTDHMWGPRCYIFLRGEDVHLAPQIFEALCQELPVSFMGYSVNFSEPDPNDHNVRHAEPVEHGPVSPLCWIQTFDSFFESYLGFPMQQEPDFADWLSFSEHRLLGLTAGELFRDELGIDKILDKYRFYPEEVRIWLMASQWALVAEEQAFPGRCAMTGDSMGSRLAISRIAARLMRIAFLCARQYAPYSKWFGTAFSNLPLPGGLRESLSDVMTARRFPIREEALIQAQLLTAEMQNEAVFGANLTQDLYFNRPILVVWPEQMADGLLSQIQDGALKSLPLCGTLSEVENLTVLWDEPKNRPLLAELYRRLAQQS